MSASARRCVVIPRAARHDIVMYMYTGHIYNRIDARAVISFASPQTGHRISLCTDLLMR